MSGKLVETIPTPLTESEAAYNLREGFKLVTGEYPSVNSLAILWAHTALETSLPGKRFGRILNNNWGNIKKTKDHDYCMYACSEIINGKNINFVPPHPETHFNAYPDAVTGAKEYIEFISKRVRYQPAWQELLAGNPTKYCAELKKGGYFTADLIGYTNTLTKLTNEFKKKSETLLSWKPPVKEPEPEIITIPPIVQEEPKPAPIVKVEKPKSIWSILIEFILKLLK